jgi:hypothetical protein
MNSNRVVNTPTLAHARIGSRSLAGALLSGGMPR